MTTTHSRVLRADLLSFEGDPGEDDIPLLARPAASPRRCSR